MLEREGERACMCVCFRNNDYLQENITFELIINMIEVHNLYYPWVSLLAITVDFFLSSSLHII